MKRQQFIRSGIAGLSGMWFLRGFGTPPPVPGEHAAFETETVKAFVAAGHNDLDKVREMLSEAPNLIYAKYDWGGGDYEEAIEGAGHVGHKEIANYLIQQGARVNLFVLTMLGKADLVRPALEEFPALIHARGPHGFTLLHHAEVGGEDAAALRDYLWNKGLRETKVKLK